MDGVFPLMGKSLYLWIPNLMGKNLDFAHLCVVNKDFYHIFTNLHREVTFGHHLDIHHTV